MIKLIGYLRKQGNFTNKDSGELVAYDNIELYFTSNEKPDVKGLYCDSAKAKTEDLKVINAKDLDAAIGKEVYLITDLTKKTDEQGKARIMVEKVVVVG